MAKLTWSINADNRITWRSTAPRPTRAAAPSSTAGPSPPASYAIDPLTAGPKSERHRSGTYAPQAHQYISTPIDTSLKWNSQFLDKRLLLDVMVGTHYQNDSAAPPTVDGRLDQRPRLTTTTSTGAAAASHGRPATASPSSSKFADSDNVHGADGRELHCSSTAYTSGARRDLNDAIYNRYHGSIIVSYLANALGHHLIKAGVDGEFTSYKNDKSNRVFIESEDGSQFDDEERFGPRWPGQHPDNSQLIDPLQQEDRAHDRRRLHPGQLEHPRQGDPEPGSPLRHAVLLQHRRQRGPVAAEPVVAAPRPHLRPHPERQVEGLLQLRPLLRERAARLRRRRAWSASRSSRAVTPATPGLRKQPRPRRRLPEPGEPARQQPTSARACPTSSSSPAAAPDTARPGHQGLLGRRDLGGGEYEILADSRSASATPAAGSTAGSRTWTRSRAARLHRQPGLRPRLDLPEGLSATTTP